MFVYLITNQINQKRYVGITSRTIAERFEEHCNQIESKKTKKSAIHEAIVKYGRENFIIEQIDSAQTTEELYQKERYWIEKLGTHKVEYNLTLGGDGSLGRVSSEETKNKIREKAKQRMQSPEQRQHLSQKTKQYYEQHPEEREKRRIAQTGNVPTKETCEKISRATKGKKHNWSVEGKQRLVDALKTRTPPPISEATRDKFRKKALANNPMENAENRRKVGLSKIGRKRYYRADGSFYMAHPDNPIDPRI